ASQEALSISNTAVLFQDNLEKVPRTTNGEVWALTPDRPFNSGLTHHRRGLEHMKLLGRKLL
ncbi:MAG: hypothetical protein ABJL67_20765, partial [Sulfitobacter sp.]